jgi:DNA-directed RNA polymerase subunit K/omega
MTTQQQETVETNTGDAARALPEDPEQSVYRYITVVAKRARQLLSGSRPKVHMPSRKLTRVAMEEGRRGFIPFIDPETALPVEPKIVVL